MSFSSSIITTFHGGGESSSVYLINDNAMANLQLINLVLGKANELTKLKG